MLANDEVWRTGGIPHDLSCSGIELQAQIAVHVFPIFRITTSFFSYLCIYFLGYTSDVCSLFKLIFPFWQSF